MSAGGTTRVRRTDPAEPKPARALRPGQLAAMPLIWLIQAYQVLLSPTTGASCRFYPSCSAYAVIALRRFGLLRGGWLAARRLGRCHPWNPGGVDHVPRARFTQSH